MNALLAEVKQKVTCKMFADRIGLRQNRSGFCVCPFHHEKTASLKIYDNNSWHCFGCRQGGDVVDMARLYYELDFQDALKQLAADFGITSEDVKKRGSDVLKASVGIAVSNLHMRQEESVKTALEAKFWYAFDKWLENERKIMDNSPADTQSEWSDAFVDALNNRAELSWRLACAESGRSAVYARK